MINKAIIVGYGEVGRAHFNNLSKAYGTNILYKDKGPEVYSCEGEVKDYEDVDAMFIATQCDPSNIRQYIDMVISYADIFNPKYINILTTVPVGTTEKIAEYFKGIILVSHSTTRGMHPTLDRFMLAIPKHIGGPGAAELKKYFEGAGWECYTHGTARTTELAHILNNTIYGVNVKAADEAAKVCRHYGVDYQAAVMLYGLTNNIGFERMGYESRIRPILTPLNGGPIGGHCVSYSANLIPAEVRGECFNAVAEHNKKLNKPDKIN